MSTSEDERSTSTGDQQVQELVNSVLDSRQLVVASNRGPVTFALRPDGSFSARQGSGGLVTAISAVLHVKTGPVGEVAVSTAEAALTQWLADIRRLGAGLPRSGIDAALHQAGMNRVELAEPAADIICDRTQWVRVTAINLSTVVDSDDE